MPISKLRPSFTLTEDRLKELQAVVPEAFADGRINWDTLREALGESLEDEAQEHFGLFWPGKREARRLAALPSKGTLIPQPGAGVDEDNTHNLFIEGDNLEVLKLLQKSYAGRVKMIYIDPPYNTGNDFVYPDDYSEPLDAYLERTGQKDETGQLLTTNSRASGRFHSNWLNMMYPRLLLARKLLSDDGVIFVSIDDTEVHNLHQITNEIFGEENFVANIIWQKKYAKQNDATWFSTSHDHILLYAADKNFWRPEHIDRTDDQLKGYTNPDNDPRGVWQSVVYTCNKTKAQRPNLYYGIRNPKTKREIFPNETRVWGYSQSLNKKHVEENRLWWGSNFELEKPRLKVFLSEVGKGLVPDTIWLRTDSGDTQDAKRSILELFGESVFDTPKPTKLIRRMLQVATDKDSEDIILDFFAGSCTTAQAIFEMNREDGGRRRFIMVQLPEPTKMKSFPTIAEIGKERIRRAITKIKKEKSGKMKLSEDGDLGFKSLKLIQSHFVEWQPYTKKDTSQLEIQFTKSESPIVEGWAPENLLSEIFLLQGFPLDSEVNSLPEFKANAVQQVTSEFVTHPLYVCLDKKIKPETVSKLKLGSEDIFVCLDSALSDEAKVKLADQCNLKVI